MTCEERNTFCDLEPLTRVIDNPKDSPHPLPQAPNGLAPPSISSRHAIPLSHQVCHVMTPGVAKLFHHPLHVISPISRHDLTAALLYSQFNNLLILNMFRNVLN
jgi:hypothetical protein